ncbi:MAG: cupin domain-containing protein, partial [Myxococcales bacterium]|nr:cupin domain-containing protein [Myxococcales bacterium]
PCIPRKSLRLSDAGALTQFGVHLLHLPPGAWSSQRHWHSHEDEFAYVLEGEVILVEDDGETTLVPGDAAAWPAGSQNGHHLQNRSDREAIILVVGSRNDEDHGEYPDIDMIFTAGRYSGVKNGFRHKDGTPY